MTDAGGTSEGAEHRKERKDRENRDRDDRGAEEGAYRAVRSILIETARCHAAATPAARAKMSKFRLGDVELGETLDQEYARRIEAAESSCDRGRGDLSACHMIGECLATLHSDYARAAEHYAWNCPGIAAAAPAPAPAAAPAAARTHGARERVRRFGPPGGRVVA